MTINLPDDILTETGLTERDLVIELACRLYDAEKLSKSAASYLCGLVRLDFERELAKRGLPVYGVTQEEWELDKEQLKRLR
jgi:predicted HTH domain antitoxin